MIGTWTTSLSQVNVILTVHDPDGDVQHFPEFHPNHLCIGYGLWWQKAAEWQPIHCPPFPVSWQGAESSPHFSLKTTCPACPCRSSWACWRTIMDVPCCQLFPKCLPGRRDTWHSRASRLSRQDEADQMVTWKAFYAKILLSRQCKNISIW